MINWQTLNRYYKVGNFLHIVALFAFSITIFSVVKLSVLTAAAAASMYLFWGSMVLVFGSMCVLAELDGFSRYQNYKQVKDQVFINGYQKRLLKPLTRSSCQREAAILACEELGLGAEVKNYFWEKGYRWYHIIPDFVFEYPFFFFSFFFWRTTFFTPYYKSKFNYNEMDLSEIDLFTKGLGVESAA
jgi:hypothetical protein